MFFFLPVNKRHQHGMKTMNRALIKLLIWRLLYPSLFSAGQVYYSYCQLPMVTMVIWSLYPSLVTVSCNMSISMIELTKIFTDQERRLTHRPCCSSKLQYQRGFSSAIDMIQNTFYLDMLWLSFMDVIDFEHFVHLQMNKGSHI